MTIKSLYCLIALFLWSNVILAQWSTEPSENLKVAGGAINPQICTDGNGGAYIAWETGAFPNRRLLRIQHLDRFGFKQFPEQGLPIRLGEFDQANLKLLEDGQGGAIVVFNELLPVADTLKAIAYAQRIDSVGTRVWGDSAVVVSPSPAHQIPFDACGDNDGGVFIFWAEDRNQSGADELYGNRINKFGEPVLGTAGILIAESTIDVAADAVNSDGPIVSFNRDSEIRVQKFTDELTPLWGEGIDVGLPFRSAFRKMFSDGQGGVVLSNKEQSFFDNEPFFKLWAQRLDGNGISMWNEGIVLADSVKDPTTAPTSIYNLDDTFYFIWKELQDDKFVDVFINRVDIHGEAIWNDKLPVSRVPSSKTVIDAAVTSGDKIIVAWLDFRNSQFDIYGQLINAEQARLWGESDIAISVRNDTQADPVAVSDGNKGVVVSWYEIGAGTGNGVFAQQVSRDGKLGDVIVSVQNPNDESLPSSFNLYQSYPNPFNPNMTIQYSIPMFSHVTLKIFDLTGKKVITILDKMQQPGIYQVNWNGKNQKGGEVASGLYFYQLRAGSFVQIRRALLVK